MDSFASISKMKRRPLEKAVLRIPLCRLVKMPHVRPTLRPDVLKLMDNFQEGYLEHSSIFYVAEHDEKGHQKLVTNEVKDS